MLKQIARLRVGLVISLGILLFYSAAFAMADRVVISRRGNRGHHGGDRHYYRDGRWYKHDSRGSEVFVSFIAPGMFIEALPPQHTTVVIQGSSYYHDGDHYYRQERRGGYVVVAPPVIVQPRSQSNNNGRGDRGDNSHNEGNRDQHR
jgi:Ni/Co efflux regulator RcnB